MKRRKDLRNSVVCFRSLPGLLMPPSESPLFASHWDYGDGRTTDTQHRTGDLSGRLSAICPCSPGEVDTAHHAGCMGVALGTRMTHQE